jgi:hypothetical protein
MLSQNPGLMIEIFRTNVQEVSESDKIVQQFLEHFPLAEITFDLEDCDKVLRISNREICIETIIGLMKSFGYSCIVLE